ncbi:unnamed protein product [Moneuplotes crassus]|uniref:Uncharacterized protein n=1 Tax=Euplotes crassus TaxID=5936 RepID=A0AAD1XVG8_EUPCR|nr:unnamed protein product [Moneuplotes crassus]
MDKKTLELTMLEKGDKIDHKNLLECVDYHIKEALKQGNDFSIVSSCFTMICNLVFENCFQKKSLELSKVHRLVLHQTKNQKMFKKALENPFVKEISECIFVFNSANTFKRHLSVRKINNYLPRVTTSLRIDHLNISSSQLRKILQVGRHIKDIVFGLCKIKFTSFELSNSLHYSTTSLAILPVRDPIIEFWRRNLANVHLLLKAISETNMKISLKEFQLGVPDAKEKTEKYVKDLEMGDLKLIFHN